jgi:hypothetical protein
MTTRSGPQLGSESYRSFTVGGFANDVVAEAPKCLNDVDANDRFILGDDNPCGTRAACGSSAAGVVVSSSSLTSHSLR